MNNALDLLERDYALNYPLIYALKHGAELIGANENGVAVYRSRPDFMLLAGPNPLDLVRELPQPDLIEICGGQNAKAVAAHFGLEGSMECFQFYYPHPAIQSDLQLEPAALPDLGFILAHYDRLEPDEIEQAILENRLFILRDGGGPFAFIGLHDDFSMGMLLILPEYRRKGWAERLERALTARVLEMGELPYGHVFIDNENSLRLQEKLGFIRCSDTVFWMWKGE